MERASYEQWLEKFNNSKYWNCTVEDVDHFYQQDEQLAFTGWTQGMLYDASRYAGYWLERNSDYAKNHPMEYGEGPPYPDFRMGSGYVSPYQHLGGLSGEPFTIEPLPVAPKEPEPIPPGFKRTPWGLVPTKETTLTPADLAAIKAIVLEALES